MKHLKYLLLLISMLLLSGCNGCNDGVLGTACSWRSDAHVFCTGTAEDFIFADFTAEQKLEYETGICKVGRIHCVERTITFEEYCPVNSNKCVDKWNRIKYNDICVGNIIPIEEECGDGLDNNCDGGIDEGYDLDGDGYQTNQYKDNDGALCGADCNDNDANIHPDALEICDGIDNNCNCIDNDSNADGIVCGCSADPDCVSDTIRCCDTNVDEGPWTPTLVLDNLCYPEVPPDINIDDLNFDTGTCEYNDGKTYCDNGEIRCDAPPFVGPEPELCDALDNDCNGMIDDEVVGSHEPCGIDIGECSSGYVLCDTRAQDMICVDSDDPSPDDQCDGLDNDCDYQIDEHYIPEICHNGCPGWGVRKCMGGNLLACNAQAPESENLTPCDGLDNDCDGQVDEDQVCECDPDAEIGPFAPDCMLDEMFAAGLRCGVGKKECVYEPSVNGYIYGPCELRCDPWVNGAPQDDLSTWYGVCPAEQCDAWDHNCYDGPVDGISLVEVPCLCSSNHPNTSLAAHAVLGGNCEEGACTAGTRTCECTADCENPNIFYQTWELSPADCGAIGPAEELACTEIDEDCDGEVDEGDSFTKADIVFIIDVTGSMGQEFVNLHSAINAYASDFTQALCDDGNGGQEQCHKFSLVLFPEPAGGQWEATSWAAGRQYCGSSWTYRQFPPDPRYGGPYFNVTKARYAQSLVDVGPFLTALNDVVNIGLVCGSEPSYDVLKAIADPTDPISIGWRADAYPYVFFLGDENAQSWEPGLMEAAVSQATETCDGIGICPCVPPDCAAMTNEFELHCFLEPRWYPMYDSICYNEHQTTPAGGADNEYDINTIDADILRNIFADVCLQQNP